MALTCFYVSPAEVDRAASRGRLANWHTLGVGMHVQALADVCRAGHLLRESDGPRQAGPLVVAAADWPLDPHLQAVATDSPNLQALLAMAVIRQRWPDGSLSGEVNLRIKEAATSRVNRWRPTARAVGEVTSLDALAMAVRRSNYWHFEEALAQAQEWLADGRFRGIEMATEEVVALRREQLGVAATLDMAADGRVAVYCGKSPHAMEVALAHAPVAIIDNPSYVGQNEAGPPVRRVVIGYQPHGYLNVSDLLAALNWHGAGWRHRSGFFTSAKGVSIRTPLRTIISEVTLRLPALSA